MLKTINGRDINIKQYTWQNIRHKVLQLNKKLACILDEVCSNDKEYIFSEVMYNFGMDIIKNGKLYLPLSDNKTIRIDNSELPQAFIQELCAGNTDNILGITISKNLENYLEMGDKVISYSVSKPGDILGFSRILSPSKPAFTKNLRSGMRNIFILPKISDNIQHKRMQRILHLSAEKPNSYRDQGNLFAEIAKACKSRWKAKILLFPHNLTQKLRDHSPEVKDLHRELLEVHRSMYGVWHNDMLMWSTIFSNIETTRHLHPGYSTVLDTVKHVFSIAADSAPGFIPSSSEDYAPIKLIQEAYLDAYQMIEHFNHFPIVMVPRQIGDQTDSVYYSLNYSTSFGYSPEPKSILATLDIFWRALEIYREGVLASNAKSVIPSLYNAIKYNHFECYHPDPSNYRKIKNSNLLPIEDSRFASNVGEFANHGPFLKGCIRISPIKK